MRNKVANPFFSKLILKLGRKQFEGNTETTRSLYDNVVSERVSESVDNFDSVASRALHFIKLPCQTFFVFFYIFFC